MNTNRLSNADIPSRTATPVPVDAPPSVKATSSARKQIRAEQKRRMFPTVEYSSRVSHFDPRSEYHDFRGFFVLFWVALAIMAITSMLRNYKETGFPLVISQWDLFTQDIWWLGLSDLTMTATTYLCIPLQKLHMRSTGNFRWNKGGIIIQSIFQALWLSMWVGLPFILEWAWTAQVFFTMHTLVLFMKMHSYAFYLGHLSETRRRLQDLDRPEGKSRRPVLRYPSGGSIKHDIRAGSSSPTTSRTSSNELTTLREDLAFELTSPLGHVTYPQNLTYANFTDFLFCPTLCYELEYPRTQATNWLEVFYKTLAVFGCIFLLTITSEQFIIPALQESSWRFHEATASHLDRALVLAETISMLLFPFMVCFLLIFLVIFEYVLGAFAELTCFADRHFYADWWNSCDWLEFSREWNVPVHHFLQRHVYSASRGVSLSKPAATLITFFISALAHELVMGCITKKVRGYGFVAMMLQMPIVMIQRSKWVRGRTLLNNVLFWCSMILGLSMMCALYVLV